MASITGDRVLEWHTINGGVLGALVVCDGCNGSGVDEYLSTCLRCSGGGQLHQPYRLPNGEPIDLWKWAEVLIQIEPSHAQPSQH